MKIKNKFKLFILPTIATATIPFSVISCNDNDQKNQQQNQDVNLDTIATNIKNKLNVANPSAKKASEVKNSEIQVPTSDLDLTKYTLVIKSTTPDDNNQKLSVVYQVKNNADNKLSKEITIDLTGFKKPTSISTITQAQLDAIAQKLINDFQPKDSSFDKTKHLPSYFDDPTIQEVELNSAGKTKLGSYILQVDFYDADNDAGKLKITFKLFSDNTASKISSNPFEAFITNFKTTKQEKIEKIDKFITDNNIFGHIILTSQGMADQTKYLPQYFPKNEIELDSSVASVMTGKQFKVIDIQPNSLDDSQADITFQINDGIYWSSPSTLQRFPGFLSKSQLKANITKIMNDISSGGYIGYNRWLTTSGDPKTILPSEIINNHSNETIIILDSYMDNPLADSNLEFVQTNDKTKMTADDAKGELTIEYTVRYKSDHSFSQSAKITLNGFKHT